MQARQPRVRFGSPANTIQGRNTVPRQTLDYLKTLLSFSSVSSESNLAITDQVDVWLQELGFQTERTAWIDHNGVTKCNVVGRLGSDLESGLAWCGHTDVVPVDSWSFAAADPWTAYVTADRVYGRGSCDMKGPVACMLGALAAMDRSSLRKTFWFAATADEEVGMLGARRLVSDSVFYREIVRTDTPMIIGEPTELRVVCAHKGGRTINVDSQGTAAHSSTGLGNNSNFALIPFLQEVLALRNEMESSAAWIDHRFTPPTTSLNLLLHDNNSGINITSSESGCRIFFRPMPGQDADAAVCRLMQVATECGLQAELVFSSEPLDTPADSPFIQELQQLSGGSPPATAAYGTDGAILTELSQVAVIGPGSIAQAHTDDEWIALDQLDRGTEFFRQCVQHWCC